MTPEGQELNLAPAPGSRHFVGREGQRSRRTETGLGWVSAPDAAERIALRPAALARLLRNPAVVHVRALLVGLFP